MVLSLFTIAGVFLMVQAFHSGTPAGKNASDTVVAISYPYFTSLSSTRDFVTSQSITTDPGSTSTNATFNRRGHEGLGDAGMDPVPLHTFGQSSRWTFVTPINPTTISSWFSATSPRMTSTFETIFSTITISDSLSALTITDSAPTTMEPFIVTAPDRPITRSGKQKVPPPTSIRSPTGIYYLSIASQMDSEAGVFSTTASDSSPGTSTSPYPSYELESATTTEGAATSASLATFAPIISALISPSPVVSLSTPAPSYVPSSSESSLSLATSTEESAVTSAIQDPAAVTGESHNPDEEGHSLPWNYNPFASTVSVPTGSLTSLVFGLSATPTQGVPSTPLSSVAASISSSVATSVATATLASASLTASSLTTPTTRLQSVPPTLAPTNSQASTPTLTPPSDDSKKRLSVGLGVCLPILVLLALFIAFWLRIRYVERKKKDDLEKDVIWATPPPSTPNGSRTLLNMTGMVPAGRNKSEGKRASTPVMMNPLAMNPLNEQELEIARRYGLAVDMANAQKADGTMTSARSPGKTVQRRSGGANLSRQWVDGASDTPPRLSQTFAYNQNGLLDPFSDANAIGLAVSTNNDHCRDNRNDFHRFQPTRLSTITDKSGEIEMPDLPATYGGAGSGLITQGGSAKGRFFERFMMKRKGMMPLDG